MTVNSSALTATHELLNARKDRSAWNRGVTAYALNLQDAFIDASAVDLEHSALLNGASSWAEYSYGGSALNYDSDIAGRLCTPSELKRKRGGELPPNSRERDYPPRMRGKPRIRHTAAVQCRIPPRACGENKLLLLARLLNGGSPPRVRGKPIPGEYDGKPTRITPAHAGKTCFTSGLHSPASDHPRACGENNVLKAFVSRTLGSPPRMRGKPRKPRPL